MRGTIAGALAATALTVTLAAGAVRAETTVTLPACAEMEGFLSGLDETDRWTPVDGSRAWIPRGFGAPEFAALFGRPALEWQEDDTLAVAGHIYECGQSAGREGRRGARGVFYGARKHFQNGLRGVVKAHARAEARRAAEAEKTETGQTARSPATPRKESSAAQGPAATRMGEARIPACAPLLGFLRGLDPERLWQPPPARNARLPAAFAGADFAGIFGLGAMEMTREQASAIGARIYECGEMAGRREERDVFYGARRYFISNLPAALEMRALDAERERRAAERERAAAEAERARIAGLLAPLLEQPDSPDLLVALAAVAKADPNDFSAQRRLVRRYGNEAGRLLAGLRVAGVAMSDPRVADPLAGRIAALRKTVAADLRANIAAAGADAAGMNALRDIEFPLAGRLGAALGDTVRTDLQARLAARLQEVESALINDLERRIDAAAGADDPQAALDGIGRVMIGTGAAALSPEGRRALDEHARPLRAEQAGRLLDARRAALGDVPETLDGIQRLSRDLGARLRPPLALASEAARQRYGEAARARLGRIARRALPEFEATLAGLPETAEGLRLADSTFVSDPSFDLVPARERERYREAVRARREAIVAAREKARAEASAAAVAAGGDPALIGHRYASADLGLALTFIDERRVLIDANDQSEVTTYTLRAGAVVLEAPDLPFTFEILGSGEETRLRWFQAILTRADE